MTIAVQAYYNFHQSEIEKSTSLEFENIAKEIKQFFDTKYQEHWHCIVGDNFGSFVTFENNNFIFFEINKKSILLFKSA